MDMQRIVFHGREFSGFHGMRVGFLLWVIGFGIAMLVIRTSVFSNSLYDDQRDILIASHVANYRERPVVGPFAAGGMNSIRYTTIPNYIYGLAYRITGGVVGMYILWGAVVSLTIPLAYITVGRALGSRVLGLLTAILFLAHPVFMEMTGTIFTPHLQPLFVFIWLTAVTLQDKLTARLFIVMGTILLALVTHLSALLWIPVACIWCMREYRIFVPEQPRKVRLMINAGYVLFGAFIVWWIVHSLGPDAARIATGIGLVTSGKADVMQSSAFAQAAAQTMTRTGRIFPNIVLLVVLCIGLWFSLRHRREAVFKWAAAVWVLAFIVMVFYPGPVLQWYGFVAVPFIIIFATPIFSEAMNHALIRRSMIGASVLILAVRLIFISIDKPENTIFRQLNEISSVIISEHPFRVYFVKNAPWTTFDEWESAGLWYLMEQRTDSQLVRLSSAPHGFSPIVSPVSMLYVVCDQRIIDRYSAPRHCRDIMQAIVQLQNIHTWKTVYASDPFIVARAQLQNSLLHDEIEEFMHSIPRIQ